MDLNYDGISRIVELNTAEEVNRYLEKKDEDWELLCVIDGRTALDKPCFLYCIGQIAPPEKHFCGERC